MVLGAIFKLQPSIESPAPTFIVTGFEMRSAKAVFMKNFKIHQNSAILTKNDTEQLILSRFKWTNDAESLPTQYIPPTKLPCTLPVFSLSICVFNTHITFFHQVFFSLTIF